MTKNDPYFTAVDDETDWGIPETISAEEDNPASTDFQFINITVRNRPYLKWLVISFTALIIATFFWSTFSTFIELKEINVLLGGTFALLILSLVALATIEAVRFWQGKKHLSHIETLREQAAMFIRERSHGKSSVFVAQLKTLYINSPQGNALEQALISQPDYLNDAELVGYLSERFLSQLDKEAERLIAEESIKIASLIALSPLAVVDSLVVLWRTMQMVNKINSIYGLRLTRISQWQLFIKIVKATLLAAGTEIVISSVVEKSVTGVTGVIAGSAAQGLGVGIYSAKIGVEAMKQSRPILFLESEAPNISLISTGIKQVLNKLKSEANND